MFHLGQLGTQLPPHLTQRELANGELRGQRIQDWLNHPITWLVLAALVGAYVGSFASGFGQRQTKLLLGLLYLFVLFRFPTYIGAGFFLILYAFPTAIWIGDTNFVFVSFIAISWMVRVGLGLEAPPRRTYLDWAIFAYVIAHILSLTQVANHDAFAKSLLALRHLMIPILLYYVVVNAGRSEQRLLFLTRMLTISAGLIYFTGFMERFAPGVAFLPRWYLAALGAGDVFAADEAHQRIGGVLTHALMGDFAAVTCVMQIYLAIRARGRVLWRIAHWILAALSIYVISLTGNRGALIALVAGLALFIWIFRREITWGRILLMLIAVFGVLMIGEQTLNRFEGNITLLTRTVNTYIDRGIPDTRRQAWGYVWQKIAEKPFLGHGPYYPVGQLSLSGKAAWPHNAYLFYFFSIGIVGLPTFLFLVGRVLKRTWAGHGLSIGRISLAQGLTAVMNIAIVQFLIGQLRTDHQRANVYVFLMWILFGLGILAREVWEGEKRLRAR
jgi:O-antigen ligase